MSLHLSNLLWVDEAYGPRLAQLGLDSLAALRDRFAPPNATARRTVEVHRHALVAPDGSRLEVFAKHYGYASPSWRFLGRRSKARCEYQNYAVFRALGIPCADRVACAEWRDGLGRLEGALILTRALPQALTLVDFWETHCPSRATAPARELRAGLRRQLAAMTRRIHAAGFFHNDLVWRNVLVTWQPPADPQLWWIDCPRGHFDRWSPWRRRRRLKDLASLDKRATWHASRGERLAFVRDYLGHQSRLNPETRRLARDIPAYRQSRWPHD